MAKALLVAAGMTMGATSALAQRVADRDLLGTWAAEMSGDMGSAGVRVVFQDGGKYIAMAMVEDEDDPVSFWEIGTWSLRGSMLTFTATGSSEGVGEGGETTRVKIESLADGMLDVSSEDEPMWNDLAFERVAVSPVAGVWNAETSDGEIVFLFGDDWDGSGQLAGGFLGDDSEDTFWGRWNLSDDAVSFMVSEGDWSWEAEEEEEFEEHEATIEDWSADALTMMIDGVSDDAIEFSRVAGDVLVGDWAGNIEGSDVEFSLNGAGTFAIAGDEGGQRMEISGQWAHLGGGRIFLVMSFEGFHNATVLMYRITSPTTVHFGEREDEMAEFTRQ